ncbi:MAG TPA: hypothetical protein PKA06_10390, partial [Gemmatales bacterium]|nr:hypothetical protein [Gemmatales bacterium]
MQNPKAVLQVAPAEQPVQRIGSAFGSGEDDALPGLFTHENMLQQGELAIFIDGEKSLTDFIDGQFLSTDINRLGIIH